MKDKNEIVLSEVTESDCEFLYDLLKNRDPRASISHKKMPSYDEHLRFVLSKPYSIWYIIEFRNQKVGSVYLSKQDEIGIYMIKEFQSMGIDEKAVGLLMKKNSRSRYLANVAPENYLLQEFFKKLGFKGLQYTYEIIHPEIKQFLNEKN